ncbi:murein L,D-transpeptidase [Pelagibius sp.]|uniref:L,D-transpeptidase family protein n=1 Tax=Pelagibius sp. TaxID=1931238 RepID=UPI00262510E4|nr:L,D-transpeptidase family protein [Pelagibius sp.]
MKLRAIGLGLCLLVFSLGAAPGLAQAGPLQDAPLQQALEAQLRAGVGAAATDDEIETLTVLERFYQARGLEPLWVQESGAGPKARQLSALLTAADLDALDPADYGAEDIAALLGSTAVTALAELEIRLTQGLIRFAADLGQGRTTPHVADPELFVFREEVLREEVLAVAAGAQDLEAFLQRYRPNTPRYDRQKAALAEYRALATQGGWEPIPEGPTLKPGMSDPRVGLLRARLRLWGDLKPENDLAEAGGDPDFYDEPMVEAVKWMQYRHGLTQDGAVGKKSLAALNVPIEARIEQMVLNLERRRWMPDDLGRRHIFVNLADQLLKLVEGEKTLLDMPVVVGRPYHSTPVFSHQMTYLVMNPYWNVPPSIARKELLPKIKDDVSYLASNNFTLFSDWSSGASVVDPVTVNWAAVNRNSFPYKLRQGSGDGNALGRLKFMFPNRFNIYLHDTPAKTLFGKDERTFSHGCIRVSDPPGLAAAVLAKTGDWPLQRINQTIDSGERRIVTLDQPLPVHISYLTSWVNKDGSVHFRKDVYGRDAKLAEALLGARAGGWR